MPFQINPQMRKLHDTNKPMGAPTTDADQTQDQGPAQIVEMHNNGDGTYHTMTHMSDGSEPVRADHGSYQEAQQHQAEMFQEDTDMDPDHEPFKAEPVEGHQGSGGSDEY